MSVNAGSLVTLTVQNLTTAGISAAAAWSSSARAELTAPLICVGLKSLECSPSGMGGYLGIRESSGGVTSEIHGKRIKAVLALDIYATTAAGCHTMLNTLTEKLTAGINSPLCAERLDCDETEFDEGTGLYLCRTALSCSAHICAAESGTGEFTGFTLTAELSSDE